MKTTSVKLRIAALKPRNVVAVLAQKCGAGRHSTQKRKKVEVEKDLLQRLREAGL